MKPLLSFVLRPASRAYGAAALARRRRFTARPDLRRHLGHPVISVGNLGIGGAGKTPVVDALARALVEAGERPAILSRGYRRRRVEPGVLVVRDADMLRAGVEEAGDEPFMLARRLSGVAVLVSADRYAAGRLAEARLGCTVHLLDDGFQHFQLARDLDILVLSRHDIDRPDPLPLGRLREPVEAAAAADIVLRPPEVPTDAISRLASLGAAQVFGMARSLGSPRLSKPARSPGWVPGGEPAAAGNLPQITAGVDPILALAGIGNPERFWRDLAAAGWHLAGTLAFPDHHWYTPRDLERVRAAATEAGARAILTTEKDIVRLLPLLGDAAPDLPLMWVPLTVTLDPACVDLVLRRIADARTVSASRRTRGRPS